MNSTAKNHFRTARELLKHHWLAFLLAQLAVVAAWVTLEIAVLTAHWSGIPPVVYWPLWLSLHLAFFWVFCGLMAGIHSMALQAVDGGVPAFSTAVRCFDRGQTHLLVALLYWAAVLGGLVLAVIPGVVAAAKWAPFRFVLADRPQPVLSSLREAALLSASHRSQVFSVLALSAVVNLGGAAFLAVGLLVTFPFTVMVRASQFRALQQELRSQPTFTPLVLEPLEP